MRLVILSIITAISILNVSVSANSKVKKTHHPKPTTTNENENEVEAEAEAEKKETWTCPMHPEVKEKKNGQCPICHMDLEKKK